jgi:hypothetical protein
MKKSRPKSKFTKYRLYGIIDRHTNKLVYASLDRAIVEDELDFGEYDQDDFGMVSFTVMLN